MNAVVAHEETAVSETTTLMAVIKDAATNPAVDIDKLERLLLMHERMVATGAAQQFNAAMNVVQADLRPVAADASNPQTKSKYASYGALDHAVRPVYTRHGLSLSFNSGEAAKPEEIRVFCEVAHVNGHSKIYQIDMPADGKGAKGGDVMTKTHAVGAGVSYGKRYLLCMIFNIAIGEDRDGNSPQDTTPISADQLTRLKALMLEVGADPAGFAKYLRVNDLAELPATQFPKALAAIEAKRAKS